MKNHNSLRRTIFWVFIVVTAILLSSLHVRLGVVETTLENRGAIVEDYLATRVQVLDNTNVLSDLSDRMDVLEAQNE